MNAAMILKHPRPRVQLIYIVWKSLQPDRLGGDKIENHPSVVALGLDTLEAVGGLLLFVLVFNIDNNLIS